MSNEPQPNPPRTRMPVHTTDHDFCKVNTFPLSIPMNVLSEERAQANHSQSLERLAERGGMSLIEIYLNLANLDLRQGNALDLTNEKILPRLREWISSRTDAIAAEVRGNIADAVWRAQELLRQRGYILASETMNGKHRGEQFCVERYKRRADGAEMLLFVRKGREGWICEFLTPNPGETLSEGQGTPGTASPEPAPASIEDHPLAQIARLLREWLGRRGQDRCFWHPDILAGICSIVGIGASEFEAIGDLPALAQFGDGCRRYQIATFGKPAPIPREEQERIIIAFLDFMFARGFTLKQPGIEEIEIIGVEGLDEPLRDYFEQAASDASPRAQEAAGAIGEAEAFALMIERLEQG